MREEVQIEQRRSTRERRAPQKLTASEPGELHNMFGYCLMAVGEEPPTMKQALEAKDKAQWEAPLREEHRSIERAKTYELVERPKGKKVLRTSVC